MTFRISMLFEATDSGAEAKMKRLGAEARKTGADTAKMGTQSEVAARSTRRMGDAFTWLREKARSAGAAVRTGIDRFRGLGDGSQVAGGHVANLTNQYNDLIVGIQAGQSPMQMAIQQGLQITQVFQQVGGGRQAIGALGAAFKSLISPINLVTIASIAAGSALVGWLSSAPGKAKTFEDRMDELADAVSGYSDAVELATSDTETLTDRFGSAAGKAQDLAEGLGAFARAEAIEQLDAAIATLTDRFGPLEGQFQTANNVWQEIDRTAGRLSSTFDITRVQALSIAEAMRDIGRAEGLDAKTEEVVGLHEVLVEIFGSAEAVPTELRKIATEAANLAQQASEIVGSDEAAFRALQEHWDELTASAQEYVVTRWEEYQAANEILLTQQEQNAILAASAKYGEDSAQVADLRAAAERRAFEEMLAGLGVSEEMKDELRASFDNAQALSGVDMASGVNAAAAAAAALARDLGIALSSAVAMQGMLNAEDLAMSQPVVVGPATDRFSNETLLGMGYTREYLENIGKIRPTSTRGGGGGGGARSQANALERLIEREREELDLLRATDPLQKELIRNREALSGATVEERAAVEQLISTRLAEQEALEESQERSEAFRDILGGAFRDLVLEGQSVGDMLDNLAAKLAELAFQAAFFGEGPLAGLFGTGDSGGIIGMITGAFTGGTPKKAGGGRVFGKGTGTSDSVPAWLSNGEMVINAKATQRNLPLLEAINSGASMPRLAGGGMVGGGASPGGWGDVHFNLINQSSARVEGSLEETSAPTGQRAFRLVLADQVGAALKEPGGGAKRVLRNQYDVRPRGTVR